MDPSSPCLKLALLSGFWAFLNAPKGAIQWRVHCALGPSELADTGQRGNFHQRGPAPVVGVTAIVQRAGRRLSVQWTPKKGINGPPPAPASKRLC
jgi:hypothetical protein